MDGETSQSSHSEISLVFLFLLLLEKQMTDFHAAGQQFLVLLVCGLRHSGFDLDSASSSGDTKNMSTLAQQSVSQRNTVNRSSNKIISAAAE